MKGVVTGICFFLALPIILISCDRTKSDKEGPSTTKIEVGGGINSTKYFELHDFLRIHPEQRAISKVFNRKVREKGVPPSGQLDPVTIVVLYPGNQVSDYWRRSILSLKGRLEELKVPYRLYDFFTKPSGDLPLQELQLKEALAMDPDYLVFTLDISLHQRLIERLLTRSRPRLILQNITTPLQQWEGKQPFLYVGFDHQQGAEILAKEFIRKSAGEGEYALLYFTQGYVSTMRGDSFKRYLHENSRFQLVASYYTDGNQEQAYQASLQILDSYPRLKFIYACSTDVALGALKAIREKKRLEVLVNGWGGGSAELESIMNGGLYTTVMRMNDDNGVAMAEAILLDSTNRGTQVPTIYSGELVLIYQGIQRQEIEALKQQAFRYSGL